MKTLGRIPILAALGGFCALALVLHLVFGPACIGLWIVCVVAVAAFAYAAVTREKLTDYGEVFPKDTVGIYPALAGAAAMLAGQLMAFSETAAVYGPGRIAGRLTAVLGLAAAVSFAAIAMNRYKGKTPGPVQTMLPVVYCIVQLIVLFKQWGTDPVILDYCYKLFAQIGIMLGVFHLGAFPLGMGKRPRTVFFCLSAVFFSVIALADGGVVHILTTAGPALFILSQTWSLTEKP